MIFIIELSISDVNAKWKEFILVSACKLHKKNLNCFKNHKVILLGNLFKINGKLNKIPKEINTYLKSSGIPPPTQLQFYYVLNII